MAVLNQSVESYVAMAVEVYRVMFVNQVAVNINIIYSCLDIEMFKNFIHFID